MLRTMILVASAIFATALDTGPAAAFSDDDMLTIFDTNSEVTATFTQTQAEALGTREIVTTTPWTTGKIRFSGVSGQQMMEAAGLSGVDFTAIAMDDYTVTFTWSDLVEHDALFATRMDGERLTLDRKGPFWVIFDFDTISEADRGPLSAKSIWHLHEIEVE